MKNRKIFFLILFLSIYFSYVFSLRYPRRLQDRPPISREDTLRETATVPTTNLDLPKVRCYNGTVKNGRCFCSADYVGEMCERKMNCLGYERKDSTYCVECRPGWKGDFCDDIDCGAYGKRITFNECSCTEPYSGPYCKELLTDDVNLTYNKAVVDKLGPLGIIFVIPMIIIVIGCKRLSEKKNAQRVEKALEEQHNRDLDSKEVAKLLKK